MSYINGGLECGGGVKESKVKPGQFWKHCDSPLAPVPSAPKVSCECLPTWTWKDAEYIGCAPEHPDSKSPWW